MHSGDSYNNELPRRMWYLNIFTNSVDGSAYSVPRASVPSCFSAIGFNDIAVEASVLRETGLSDFVIPTLLKERKSIIIPNASSLKSILLGGKNSKVVLSFHFNQGTVLPSYVQL